MPLSFSNTLVVGIASTALFDLADADRVFREEGMTAYRKFMVGKEGEVLEPGTAFPLAQALLSLNRHTPKGEMPLAEVVVMSRNSPETGVAVMSSVRAHSLPITRFAFTGGEPLAPYASAFGLDLFLSRSEGDVQAVVDDKSCAAAQLYPPPAGGQPPPSDQLRIAFDADAVLFSDESELLYKREGLPAFHANEDSSSHIPMPEGPFAAFLKKLAQLQRRLPDQVEYTDVRLSIVTARNAPAETRVITTLRAWDVYVDAAFFLGGLSKDRVLAALRPHIFFDDQEVHALPASAVVPAGKVPYASSSALHTGLASEDPPRNRDAVSVNRSPADTLDELDGPGVFGSAVGTDS